MEKFQNKYLIRSIRLKYHDYSQSAFYFVTICTHKRKYSFGKIINKKMYYSKIGQITKYYYEQIPKYFPFVRLDSFIVTPNHIHGIIVIDRPELDGGAGDSLNNGAISINEYFPDYVIGENFKGDAINRVSTIGGSTGLRNPMLTDSLGRIIRWFKGRVSFELHKLGYNYFKWQDRYYEHIIRKDNTLINVRYYIKQNHVMWERDRNNFDNILYKTRKKEL